MARRERARQYIAWLSGDGGDYGPFASIRVRVPMPDLLAQPPAAEPLVEALSNAPGGGETEVGEP